MLRPLNDFMLVKPLEVSEKSSGGVILTGVAKEALQYGEVIAVGPGWEDVDSDRYPQVEVKENEIVLCKLNTNPPVKINGEDFWLIQGMNMLAVREDNNMLKPLGDNILVKPIARAEKTEGGIFLEGVAKDALQRGEVIAVGPGWKGVGKCPRAVVEVGETVLYSEGYAQNVKVNNEDYILIEGTGLVAVDE